jgi:hypothetical protein
MSEPRYLLSKLEGTLAGCFVYGGVSGCSRVIMHGEASRVYNVREGDLLIIHAKRKGVEVGQS